MDYPIEWEIILARSNNDNSYSELIRRYRVSDNGWLVQSMTFTEPKSGDAVVSTSMTFVPDPLRNWDVEIDKDGIRDTLDKSQGFKRIYN